MMNCKKLYAVILISGAVLAQCAAVSGIDAERVSSLEQAAIDYNEGRFHESIKIYKKIASQGSLEGYLNQAIIYKDTGLYEQAKESLRKAYLEFPEDRRVLSLLGRIEYLAGQTTDAIKIYGNILKKYPHDGEALLSLGLCYRQINDAREAKRYLKLALERDRQNITARVALAELYSSEKAFKEAIQEYTAVYSLDPSLVGVQRKLAELYFRLGNYEQSLRMYRKLKAVDPEDAIVAQRLTIISNQLGKEYFDNEKKRLESSRKEKKIFVKPLPASKDEPVIKVKLAVSAEMVSFKCSVPFEMKEPRSGESMFQGEAQKNYTIVRSQTGGMIIKSDGEGKQLAGRFARVELTRPEGTVTVFNVNFGSNNFWAGQGDRTYRGAMEVSVQDTSLQVVNIVTLEEYVCSVLPSEMPADWPLEALKAQAVAARTEAVHKMGRHKKEGFDFCAEVHCQVYNGVEGETVATQAAVDATRGEVMMYAGKPIDAIYSSNCGGHTQGNIFADRRNIPYWQGRLDMSEGYRVQTPFSPLDLDAWLKSPPSEILCNSDVSRGNNNFRWVRIYDAQELNEIVSKLVNVGEVRQLTVVKRSSSGHIEALKITGTGKEQIIEKELNIRQVLGNVRSSMFIIETKTDGRGRPQQFILYGGGWGHGVGMCQSGACSLAAKGKKYAEILRHYFSGIEFRKLYQ